MKKLSYLFLILMAVLCIRESAAQVQFVSPAPDARWVLPETSVSIRFQNKIKPVVNLSGSVRAIGSVSGFHAGKSVLSDNQQTLIFYPETAFAFSETVQVEVAVKQLMADNILPDAPYHFTFTTADSKIQLSQETYLRNALQSEMALDQPIALENTLKVTQDTVLPDDFPARSIITVNNPSPGYLFLSNFTFGGSPYVPYLMILDNAGNPVFYRKMNSWCLDFKVQGKDTLTYYNNGKFYALNKQYAVVDSFYCGNGYTTDVHECRLLPHHHALMLSYDYQKVDMSAVVAGGLPNATVIGLVIQEIDSAKNVVFQWRSWDHLAITETGEILPGNGLIDYVHGNALEVDEDGNLLVCARHLNAIIKINRQTGEVIWRWGGKMNQFSFTGSDTITFDHQHAIRRLPDGNYTMFDNGNSRGYSRALEFNLDQVNKVAHLVWEYRSNPDIFGVAMGNVQRLPNGNTLIGYGAGNPTVVEVRPDGSKAYEMTLPYNMFSYRAYRYPWTAHLLMADTDSLDFYLRTPAAEVTKILTLTNVTDTPLTITDITVDTGAFQVQALLPLSVMVCKSISLPVVFKPTTTGSFSGNLQITSDGGNERVRLTGFLDSSSPIVVYPNPFSEAIHIQVLVKEESDVSVRIFDLQGRQAATFFVRNVAPGKHLYDWQPDRQAAGLFLCKITVQAHNTSQTSQQVLKVFYQP